MESIQDKLERNKKPKSSSSSSSSSKDDAAKDKDKEFIDKFYKKMDTIEKFDFDKEYAKLDFPVEPSVDEDKPNLEGLKIMTEYYEKLSNYFSELSFINRKVLKLNDEILTLKNHTGFNN